MLSKILYDTRDNSILRCQPEPKGSTGLPSFEALCKSARVTEDEKEYLDTIVVGGGYLTHTMQDNFRIVEIDGEIQVKKKPKVEITSDSYELSLSNDDNANIIVDIVDTLENETFDIIDIYVENATIDIPLTNNTGSEIFTFSSTNTYEVGAALDKFRCNPITIKVVE